MCPQCVNESRQTNRGKPIPNTYGVMLMDSLGQKDLMEGRKKRKDPPTRASTTILRPMGALKSLYKAPERVSGRTAVAL
jgi:hypothetical protein